MLERSWRYKLRTVRLLTYNLNSISARLPRLLAVLDELDPDIVCLQETKITAEAFPHDTLGEAGYIAADHSAGRWNGVAVLARKELGLDDVAVGLSGEVLPDEARWVEATVDGIRVASAYVPNGQAVGSEPFMQKLAFLDALAARASVLAASPSIIAGDMNVCPADLDVWDSTQVHGATHITDDERSRLAAVIAHGFVDSFRMLNPSDQGFTWWDYRFGAFHKAQGLRIDLVLASESLSERLVAATVDREFRKPTKVRESKPSDHAPLIVDFA